MSNAQLQIEEFIEKYKVIVFEILGKRGENVGHMSSILNGIGNTMLSMKLYEIEEKFGKELDKEQVTAIIKIMTTFSTASTPEGLMESQKKFMKIWDEEPVLREKTWKVWKIFAKIMRSI
jgi:hypothetical protein